MTESEREIEGFETALSETIRIRCVNISGQTLRRGPLRQLDELPNNNNNNNDDTGSGSDCAIDWLQHLNVRETDYVGVDWAEDSLERVDFDVQVMLMKCLLVCLCVCFCHSFIYSLTHLFIHSFTHSLAHSFIH